MNHTLKNHTNQEILSELEKRLATNSLTRNEITTLSSIISEHLYLFYRTFQPPKKTKKTKIPDQPLSEEEQKKVDQFWKKYGFKDKK